MKNLKHFFAFIVSFFLSYYIVSAAEPQEDFLRQSAMTVLRQNKFNITDVQGMNYTIQTKLTPENFENAIRDGWRLTLLITLHRFYKFIL